MRFQYLILLAILGSVASANAQEKSGAEVYKTVCSECHGGGKFNAPVMGDKKRWGKLVREGLDDLVPAALRGIRKMPAKGGDPTLSDLEVARAVVHMTNAGGGNFAEPDSASAARWRKIANAQKKTH